MKNPNHTLLLSNYYLSHCNCYFTVFITIVLIIKLVFTLSTNNYRTNY